MRRSGLSLVSVLALGGPVHAEAEKPYFYVSVQFRI